MPSIQIATNSRARLVFATTLDLSVRAGPTEHVGGIVRNLSSKDFDVVVVSPTPFGKIAPGLLGSATVVHYPSAKTIGLPSAFSGLLAIKALFRLRNSPLLYIRGSSGTLPLTGAAHVMRFRRMVIEHNGWLADEVTTYGYPRLFAAMVRFCQVWEARLASANRTVTDELLETLVRFGVPRDTIEVIENGADTSRYYPLDQAECRRRLGLPSDGMPVLAYLGNLWSGAGLETLLNALEILDRRGKKVRLAIAGDGNSRAALEAEASRRFPNDCRIHFTGWLSTMDANPFLGAADVAVAPYLETHNSTAGNSALKISHLCRHGQAGCRQPASRHGPAGRGALGFPGGGWKRVVVGGRHRARARSRAGRRGAMRPGLRRRQRLVGRRHEDQRPGPYRSRCRENIRSPANGGRQMTWSQPIAMIVSVLPLRSRLSGLKQTSGLVIGMEIRLEMSAASQAAPTCTSND